VKCPLCNAPTEVKDTRTNVDCVIRRRVCFNMHTFKTEERAVSELVNKYKTRVKGATK
jgi:transcriptional regulator NrdR family protein